MKLGVGNDRITIFVLFAFFAAGFFAGCSNPVSDEPVRAPRVLVVQIAGEVPAERTALPPAPSPAEYTISVNRGAAGLGSSTFTAGAGSYAIELTDDPAAGDVVQVEGFDGGKVKITGGSYPLTAADIDGTPVSVTLHPLREGTGDVRLSVSFEPGNGDDEIAVAELSLYRDLAAYRAGTPLSDHGARYRKDSSYGEGTNFTGSSPVIIPIEYEDLPSGDYVLMIEFFRSAGPATVKVSRLVQTIIVRGGLTTGIWDSSNSGVLTWNAFASSNADLAGTDGIKIDGTAIRGYDPAAVIYTIYEPTRSVPTGKTLTVTIGEPGQTVTVNLNKSTDVPLASGAVYTLGELEAMGAGSPMLENTLTITVTAPDGLTEKFYIVNISGKEIIDFYFEIDSQKYGAGSGVVHDSGSINETAKTITVTVPYGTPLTSLTPTVVHSGTSIVPDLGTRDFTSSVTYTLTAADVTETQTYTVTVDVAKIVSVTAVEGPLLSPDGFKQTVGFVSGDDIKAAITVKGTDSLGTAITLDPADYSVDNIIGAAPKAETAATLKVAGSKTVGGTEESKTFDVYIKNDAKAITEFYFAIGSKKYGVGTGTVADSGNINEAAKTVTVIVPFGTDLTRLSPVVTVSEGASSDPESGEEKAFTGSVTYTVTPEDESSPAPYIVTVKDFGITITVGPPGNLAVLSFSSIVPIPPVVAASTLITVEITGDVTVGSGNWHIDINGPIPVVSLTYPEADQVAFNAPAVPGFYNVNVIATVGGIDYSGSFRLTVE